MTDQPAVQAERPSAPYVARLLVENEAGFHDVEFVTIAARDLSEAHRMLCSVEGRHGVLEGEIEGQMRGPLQDFIRGRMDNEK